jgi:hypothetical protein
MSQWDRKHSHVMDSDQSKMNDLHFFLHKTKTEKQDIELER